MTRLVLFTVVWICCAAAGAWGQERVTLRLWKAAAEDVCREIERQTGLSFAYAPSVLEGFPPVTAEVRDATVEEALAAVFGGSLVTWRRMGRFVVLKRRTRYFVVSGHVTDAHSGGRLAGATVLERRLGAGTAANAGGFYSLLLPEGEVCLDYSFVGRAGRRVRFRLTADTTVSVALEGGAVIGEVTVRERMSREWARNAGVGRVELPAETVEAIPRLLGEADVMRAVQALPGVVAGVEGAAGMYVRGGNRDENLLLLDDIPFYNAEHLLGLFSAFTPDAVRAVDFHKAGFPARYGGRLSSVTDVRLKDGDRQRWRGGASVGLLAARVHAEGPVERGRSSFNAAARRSLLDAALFPIYNALSKSDEEETRAGYHFTDAVAKFSRRMEDESTLSAVFFWGDDVLRFRKREGEYDSGYGDVKREWLDGRWGNLAAALRWEKPLGTRWHGTFFAAYHRYRVSASRKQVLFRRHAGEEDRWRLDFGSGQREWTFRADFDWVAGRWNRLRAGAAFVDHHIVPETRSEVRQGKWGAGWWGDGWQRQQIFQQKAREVALYAEDEMTPTGRLRVTVGARAAWFLLEHKTYFSLEPRLSAQWRLGDGWVAKAAYTEMSQYIHQLRSSAFNLPTDLWVPVTERVPPMRSRQAAAGVEWLPAAHWRVSAGGFYKRSGNLLDEFNGWEMTPDYRRWEENVRYLEGRACGAELMAQRLGGRTTGWVNYTLSWSERRFADGGRPFPAKFDSRHAVNLVARHRFSDRFDMGVMWTFNSGYRSTQPLEFYNAPSALPGGERVPEREPVYHYDRPNNMKTPAYHRLDLSFNFHRARKRGVSTWSVFLYNAYCRLNPVGVDHDIFATGGNVPVYHFYFYKDWAVPLIPSFSYTFTF